MTESPDLTSSWSPAALDLWQEYTQNIRNSLKEDDADPEEVIEDLQLHVLAEQAQKNIRLLSHKDMLQILQRIGLPDLPISDVASLKPKVRKWRLIKRFPTFFGIIFLVILPILTLLDEFIFHDATIFYHDLFPSIGLMLLASLVPAFKIYYFYQSRKVPGWTPQRTDVLLNGITTMVSLWYTIVLLPMIGLGFLAAFVFFWTGIGLLGLLPTAPFFALLHGLALQIKWLKQKYPIASTLGMPSFLTGMIAGLIFILAAYLPVVHKERLLAESLKSYPTLSSQQIEKVQKTFSDQALWNRLLGPGSDKNPIPLMDIDKGISFQTRPTVFYRITGKTPTDFKSMRNGLIFSNWGIGDWGRGWSRWDNQQGNQVVGNPNADLSVKSWRMDSSIDAEGMLAYSEWTMVFKNASKWSNIEARLLLQTPPGAVVSRVTLWINGEPQEAAFGGKDQTIRAYQSVVRRNRDPLLVTQQGLDHVLAQCFPILPEQEMKIRIGITSPLIPEAEGSARFQFPKLKASNIGENNPLPPVDVWIESDAALSWQDQALPAEVVNGKTLYALETTLALQELVAIENRPQLHVPHPLPLSYASSEKLESGLWVTQGWQRSEKNAPNYVLVIDAATAMQVMQKDLVKLLKDPPTNLKSVVLAGFDPQILTPDEAAKAIKKQNFKGGPAQAPALELALKASREHDIDHILWIYAPSSFNEENTEALLQVAERRPDLPLIHACPIVADTSPLIQGLKAPFRISEIGDGTLPNFGRLETLFTGQLLRPYVMPVRELSTSIPQDAEETSDHLVRLWVKDQVDLALPQGAAQRKTAQQLAITHQVVTPLSGAVVLENAAQYKANELEQADASSVPSIPEPTTWLLALTLMGMIFWLRWRAKTCEV